MIGEVGRRNPNSMSTVSHALVEQDGALALDLARRDLPAPAVSGLIPRLITDLQTEARLALTDCLSTEPYHV